jgi:hypothetical protein
MRRVSGCERCGATRLLGPEDMGADAAAEELFGPYLVYERLG